LRFEKPDKNIDPKEVEIQGLEIDATATKVYRFRFKEMAKHRYLYSGKDARGEAMADTPASPCREIFKTLQ
jgi:hypothetical protein